MALLALSLETPFGDISSVVLLSVSVSNYKCLCQVFSTEIIYFSFENQQGFPSVTSLSHASYLEMFFQNMFS